MFFKPLYLRKLSIDAPVFCAPMAEITHSAFRRLIAEQNSFCVLFTEMLSGNAILKENILFSPYTKRRPIEKILWYQLALNGTEDIKKIIERLLILKPDAIDLNCGCSAPNAKLKGLGISLFEDKKRFEYVIKSLRKNWDNTLSIKCRLWKKEDNWKEEFEERLKIMEDNGVDLIFVHPRFFNEKFKRKARWEFFKWISSKTKIPIIANGDITNVYDIYENKDIFSCVRGIMIGRYAAVKPWIFCEFASLFNLNVSNNKFNFTLLWNKFFEYIKEDFIQEEKALSRIKIFSKYFSCNFFYGNNFRKKIQNCNSIQESYEFGKNFLKSNPKLLVTPSVNIF
jgi:tRNA-dihydrouridine synthase